MTESLYLPPPSTSDVEGSHVGGIVRETRLSSVVSKVFAPLEQPCQSCKCPTESVLFFLSLCFFFFYWNYPVVWSGISSGISSGYVDHACLLLGCIAYKV